MSAVNKQEENELNEKKQQIKEYVRARYFDGSRLADTIFDDGRIDTTQRPNVFLAHSFYKDLFSQEEWKKIFDSAIAELWLEWGGLSSISRSHPLFCAQYTGENNRSYHRGDSWIFLNNIAALSMIEIDKVAYHGKISRIIEASTTLLLKKGTAGALPELSSAEVFEPAGCPVQLWSLATYLNLLQSLKNHPEYREIFEKVIEDRE